MKALFCLSEDGQCLGCDAPCRGFQPEKFAWESDARPADTFGFGAIIPEQGDLFAEIAADLAARRALVPASH